VITRIEATRYCGFDKLDVELGDFRVLVGANGPGKPTACEVTPGSDPRLVDWKGKVSLSTLFAPAVLG
jgi:ABC-type uncharacterized transport system ATPase subunit